MRAAVLQCFYEANAFGAAPVTLRDFHASHYVSGPSLREIPGQGGELMSGVLAGLDDAGVQVDIGLCTACPPGGLVDAPSWLVLRLALLESLRAIVAKGRPEILIVLLHGALAACDAPEPEGELLEAARRLVGPDCVIACAVDFHANPSPMLVEHADLLIGGRRLPRTDGHQRGRDLVALAIRAVSRPRKTRHFALPLITPLHNARTGDHTAGAPFALIESACVKLQRRLKLDDVTVLAGFPYADTAWVNTSLLITGNDTAAVRQAVSELAELIWSQRELLLQHDPLPGHSLVAPAVAANGAASLASDVRHLPYTERAAKVLPLHHLNYGDWVFHVKMLCLSVY